MHLTPPTLLALAAFASASPLQNSTLNSRTATPALAQFFYDTTCTYLAQSTPVKPDNKHQSQTIGGPWGSRSAWFASTGGLFSWTIHGRDGVRERRVRPGVGECVCWLSGVYVSGDVRV